MSERLSAEEREALILGFRHRLRLAGNDADATRWWADDLATLAANHFERILAAHLADAEARLAKVEALVDKWERSIGPESQEFPDFDWQNLNVEYAVACLRAALRPDPSEARDG